MNNDALAVRWYDANASGSGIEEYDCPHDANFNATAVVDNSGTVLERYRYTRDGEVTFLNANFTTKSASTIGNTHLYTGRERDGETGLQFNRHRYYAAHFGRWLIRDPIEYGDSYNRYEYVISQPIVNLGPTGLRLGIPCLETEISQQVTPMGMVVPLYRGRGGACKNPAGRSPAGFLK